MHIHAIDPGPEQSALVTIDESGNILFKATEPNSVVKRRLMSIAITNLVIEEIASYGMPVGREVFQTVRWSGRFEEACGSARYIPRLAVKMHICKSPKANDSTIRQALIDRFGPGREKAIGTKKNPGPLYGISGDQWAALALALTALETQ